MLSAAEARLREAEALFAKGEWNGTIYLCGYVVEMALKVAFCRIDPTFQETDLVETNALELKRCLD